MIKKVYDIFPPQKKFSSTPSLLRKSEKIILPKIPASKINIQIKIFIFLFVLLTIGTFCYLRFSRAEITIWPETDTVNFKLELTADTKAEKIDVANKIIPLKVFEVEESISEKFISSGKKLVEKKAEGIIRVYNTHSDQDQVLVARTRFLSADGKLFRTPNRVVVPGGYYEEGKLVPGQIDIRVVADQPGSEYNIGPTTFSIPGFAGTERFIRFYAESFQSMQGGEKKEVLQVLKEDIDKAENILFDRAKIESETALKEKIPPEFIFFPEEVKSEILDSFSVAKPEAEMEEFVLEVKAKSKTLSFKKEDLEEFVINFIKTQIPPEKEIYLESLKINRSVLRSDFETDRLVVSLEIGAKTYLDIDQTALKGALSGKSLAESKMLLENQPEVVKARMELWPFWVRKVPKETGKIIINLHFNLLTNTK